MRNISFHTYTLAEERPTRVVIRRVPKEIPTSDILDDLKSQNIPVSEVHRMHRSRGGPAYDMVLVVCEPTEGRHPIFQIQAVCNLSGISIEKPNKTGVVGQCHRCQLYGHSQRNCFATPRCVKCLGDHGTSECTRPKDRTLCLEPPSCVLCGQTGHPANYRGCPMAPKSSSPKLAKRANARQQRESPTVAIPSSKLPDRLSPQRPCPWNPLSQHQTPPSLVPTSSAPKAPSAPAPKPLSPPAVSAPVPNRAPAPKAATPPAPIAAYSQQSAGPITADLTISDPYKVIASTYCIFNTVRAHKMAAEIAACKGDPFTLLAIYEAYPEITQALKTPAYAI